MAGALAGSPPPSAVLLDRDGVLNDLIIGGYVTSPAALRLRPGAASAVRRLNKAGVPVFVVTNQRGVALGLMSEADLDAVHAALRLALAGSRAHLDGIYACVHARDSCDCRKPAPGLVRRLATEHPEVDLSAAVVIGDSPSDVAMARAAGLRAVRIADQHDEQADWTSPTLAAAVDHLLGGHPSRGHPRPPGRAAIAAPRSRVDRQVRLLGGLVTFDVLGQRLAIPVGGSSQIPLGLAVGVGVAVFGVRSGLLRADRARLQLALLALVAVCTAAFAVVAGGTPISLLSLGLLIATYVPFVVMVDGDGGGVLLALTDCFLRLMRGIAVVAIGQTLLEFAGGPRGDLLGALVPRQLLLSGYNTTYPFVYGSPYDKANGIVLLEPSFCCQFLGAAILAHLWLRRRGPLPLLLLAAMVVTVSGTGFILLGAGLVAIALRGQRVRGESPVLRAVVPALVVGAILAASTSLGSIFVSRLHEGTGNGSSTGERFFVPFTTLGRSWLDGPAFALIGRGPGAASRYLITHGGGSVVPLAPLKLLFEYGAVAALPGLLFLLWSCLSGARSTPLAVGFLSSWLLLSGSLQQPATVLVLWLFTSACARRPEPRSAPRLRSALPPAASVVPALAS